MEEDVIVVISRILCRYLHIRNEWLPVVTKGH